MIDTQFNTVDVAIVVKTDLVTERYSKHYERRAGTSGKGRHSQRGISMDVVMTAPRLAEPAVALLEAAGARIHYMPPFPRAGEVAALAAAGRRGRDPVAAGPGDRRR